MLKAAIAHGAFGRVALLSMQGALVTHAHSQSHLLFNLSDAPMRFSVRSQDVKLDRDHYVAVNAWEPHCYPAQEGVQPLVLALYLERDWIAQRWPGGRFAANHAALTPTVRRIVHLFHAELLHGAGADQAFIAELVDQLLTETLTERDSRTRSFGAVADFRIRRSLDFMRANVGVTCDIAVLARSCGLSREHFFVRFQEETALTPLVYWNMLKMERALGVLAQTQEPLCQIAYELGFSAPGGFSRFFIRHQGVPPIDYRRAAQARRGREVESDFRRNRPIQPQRVALH
jgi:AraC family transcriptional regulator